MQDAPAWLSFRIQSKGDSPRFEQPAPAVRRPRVRDRTVEGYFQCFIVRFGSASGTVESKVGRV